MRDHHFFSKTDRHIHPQPAADARRIVLEHAVQFVEVAQQIFRPLVVTIPSWVSWTRRVVRSGAARQDGFQGLNLSRDATLR